MSTTTPIIEDELHAYLDGELPDARRAIVEAYLHEHPSEARRLDAYRADGAAIARIFCQAPELPVAQRAPARFWRRAGPVRAAAAVLIVAGAIAAGWIWLWQDRRDEALWARFGAEALTAYLSLNRGDSQPTMSVSLPEVAEFFSAKLKTPIRLHEPADRSYALVGSEFLTGAQGRVAQLVFRSLDGKLVTMYFEPWPRKKGAPFRPVASQSNVTTLVWVDDELGCAVTGALPRYELERVGRALYAELTKS